MSITAHEAGSPEWAGPEAPHESAGAPAAQEPAAQEPAAHEPTAHERASTLCDLGRWADAATAAAEAATAEPRSAAVWCLTSRAQLGLARPAAALHAARVASSLDAGADEPHRLASLALGELGRHDEAAEAAIEATRCAPHSWQAHAFLARCLASAGERLPEAGRAAEQARELGPDESGPHVAVGLVALASGRRQDATSAFCAAIGADPQCFEAHSQLALLAADAPSRRPTLPRLGGILRRSARRG